MNTIGKILVICNLVMALATGGFLIVDFATRSNWKKAYEELKRELVTREAQQKAGSETHGNVYASHKRLQTDLDVERSKRKEEKVLHEAEIATHQRELDDEKLRTKESELTAQRHLAEIERLKEETKGLLVTLKGRVKTVVDLEDAVKKHLAEASSYKQQADFALERNLNLRDEIRKLTTIIAEMQTRGGSETTNIVRDPNQPNPPTTYVKGKIARIDGKDRSLVEITLGSDHGVNKNHTLEVFRTQPRPEYLGTIRIIDSRQHSSVGKLMRNNLPNISRSALQEGDIVASSLNNP